MKVRRNCVVELVVDEDAEAIMRSFVEALE
jgi:hypothetical protein